MHVGEEILKVPKAMHKGGPKKAISPPGEIGSGSDRKSKFPTEGNLKLGRGAFGISHTPRSRLMKLAALGEAIGDLRSLGAR